MLHGFFYKTYITLVVYMVSYLDFAIPRVYFPFVAKSSLTKSHRYTQNGILHMIDRNRRIKSRPERLQSCKDRFELIVTCEERVYDQVLEGQWCT